MPLQTAHKPKQSLGQNFLVDPNVANNIVGAFDLDVADTVLEIGPGPGALTERLLPRVNRLIAVEIDRNLAAALQDRFGQEPNFELHNMDFLKFDPEGFDYPALRIVGNIPYNITSPILFKVLDIRRRVKDLTMLIQKEVALRAVAAPNTKDYGILAIMSQAFSEVELLLNVPRTVFRPRPKIDSALVRWTFTDKISRNLHDPDLFKTIVKQAFGQRRKMLRNTLKSYYMTNPDLWDFTLRPEQIPVTDWIELANRLHALK